MTIAVVITARPSYSRLRSLILALQAHMTVQLVVGGSAVLERYGAVADLIEAECGPIAFKAWTVYEGESLETSARSTGALLSDFAMAFRLLRPDAVLVHGDRHEVLGAAAAARMLELPLIHTQGGERTGSVDDRVRDAITQLADYHLVSTQAAADRILQMRGQHAVVTGCPSLDVARTATNGAEVDISRLPGDGRLLRASERFLVVLQHPTTDAVDAAYVEMATTLEAVARTGLPAIVLWPGDEAGMSATSKAIRERKALPIRTVRNLPPETFLRLVKQSVCLVGNSSAGIRECSYLGVPVVNIGTRQADRERAANVIDVLHVAEAIYQAIRTQMLHGPYASATLYGDGHGGARMAEAIVELLRGDDVLPLPVVALGQHG